jgi:hypothetical protein
LTPTTNVGRLTVKYAYVAAALTGLLAGPAVIFTALYFGVYRPSDA